MKKDPIVHEVIFNGLLSHYVIQYNFLSYRLDFDKTIDGKKFMKLSGLFGRLKGYWDYIKLEDGSIKITSHRYFSNNCDVILRDISRKANLNIINIPKDTLEINTL